MLTALLLGIHSAMMRALRTLCLDKLSPHWALVISPLAEIFPGRHAFVHCALVSFAWLVVLFCCCLGLVG